MEPPVKQNESEDQNHLMELNERAFERARRELQRLEAHLLRTSFGGGSLNAPGGNDKE